MPMGPSPLGYFVGLKFVGYTAAAAVIRKLYPESKSTIARVGLARTTIGIGASAAHGAFWYLGSVHVFRREDPNAWLDLAGLFPVRIAQWIWLAYLFFGRDWMDPQKAFRVTAGGAVWS
jgi:hypothetical protein